MPHEFIQLSIESAVATVTINRPKALNAMNSQTLRELEDTLVQLGGDSSVRAVILTGAGEKSFVAGGDISEMAELGPQGALRFSQTGHRTVAALEALSVPTIAAINGYALGGGLELALSCDLLYASEKAKVGLPEVTLGVIPGFGGTQRLTRLLGRARAMEMIFTGESIDAQKAKEIGLVLDVLPADKLLPHCRDIALKIASRSPVAVGQAKRTILAGMDLSLGPANELERQAFASLFPTDDQREGMKAFKEKRPAVFTGKVA
jgi:enoyl-CoA hydratase